MLRRIAWHQVTCVLPNKPSNDGTYFVSESPPWAAPDIRITSNVLVTNQPINQSINRSINQSIKQSIVRSVLISVSCLPWLPAVSRLLAFRRPTAFYRELFSTVNRSSTLWAHGTISQSVNQSFSFTVDHDHYNFLKCDWCINDFHLH